MRKRLLVAQMADCRAETLDHRSLDLSNEQFLLIPLHDETVGTAQHFTGSFLNADIHQRAPARICVKKLQVALDGLAALVRLAENGKNTRMLYCFAATAQ